MDTSPRNSPDPNPGVGPEAPGNLYLTMPEAAELLDMSEFAARDWVKRHDLPTTEGRPVRVAETLVLAAMAAEGRSSWKSPEVAPQVGGSPPESRGSGDPIEAHYTTTPAEIERAIERTGARYVADFASLYDRIAGEVSELYEAQLAAKDQALAAKEQTITMQQDSIAELRRRAEAAEAERDELRQADGNAPLLVAKEEVIIAQRDLIDHQQDELLELRDQLHQLREELAPSAIERPTIPLVEMPTPPALEPLPQPWYRRLARVFITGE